MVIEFNTKNFLSFKDFTTLSMVASSGKEHEDTNVCERGKLRTLKSAVIYGANASGKTNLVGAMGYMRSLVLHGDYTGSTDLGEVLVDSSYRLDEKTNGKASYFEITFLRDNKKYRYGFESTADEIVTEWLFYTPNSREVELFTRNEEGIALGSSFRKAEKVIGDAGSTQLFLAQAASDTKMKLATEVLREFKRLRVVHSLDFEPNLHLTLHVLEDHGAEYKDLILTLLKRFDLGIEDFEIRPISEKEYFNFPNDMPKQMKSYIKEHSHPTPEVYTKRKRYSDGKLVGLEELNLSEEESEGTKKVFALAASIIQSLKYGGVLVVDELEARLHPLISKSLFELFNSGANDNAAQLIFTTHDTRFLNNKHIRRDQVWFTEKSREGASCLYSLVEYKPRKDASLEKDYILGRYGAIPYLGNIDDLLGEA